MTDSELHLDINRYFSNYLFSSKQRLITFIGIVEFVIGIGIKFLLRLFLSNLVRSLTIIYGC